MSDFRKAPRQAGDPCPNGCMGGHGREETPVLLQVAEWVTESGDVETDPDGGIQCPSCWGWFS